MPEMRRRGPSRGRSESEILDAALRTLDTGGLEALSLRRLAADLGITANALYTYFPTKQHLEDALVDHLLAEVAEAPARGDGRQRIHDTALALRRQLLSHAAATSLVLRWPSGPGSLALSRRVLGDLEQHLALDPATASRTAYALIGYALGMIALDAAERPAGAVRPSDEDVARARRAALRSASSDASVSPELTEVVAQYNSAAQYLWGLDRILDGVAGP